MRMDSLLFLKLLFIGVSLSALSVLYGTSRITFWEFAAVKRDAVKLSVYYESLCPYSIRFITEQLYPNYQQFKSDLELNLVPYGKANHTFVNNAWQFECQHGPEECRGNKYQACVLNQNYTQDINVEFINCIMAQDDPSTEQSTYNCSQNVSVAYTPIQVCFSNEGGEVLARLGNKTKAAIDLYQTGVPTIIFGDKYNSTLHSLATTNFTEAVCIVDPGACKDGAERMVLNYVLPAFLLFLLLQNCNVSF